MNPAIFDRPSGIGALLGPGDIATPTAGYSLRNLSIGYSDNVVRVREDSGNTEQDFTAIEITDGTLSTFVGANNGYVTKWYDQFGSNDAIQATAAAQPKIWDASTGLVTENGKPALDFDGSNDWLQSNTFTASSQPITRILVAKQNAFGYLIDGSSQYRGVVGTSVTSPYNRRIFSGSINDYGVATFNNQELFFALFDGSNSQLFLNGTGLGTKNVGTDGLNQVTIGTIWDASDYFADAEIQEIIIYNSDQSANREAIEDNINDYYDIY